MPGGGSVMASAMTIRPIGRPARFPAALLAACLAIPFAPWSPGPAQARPFTAHDLVTLDRLGGAAIAPDGRTAALEIRHTDLAHNRATHAVALLDLTHAGAQPVELPGDASAPRWSPDGHRLYMLSDRHGGTTQVWRLDPGHGPAAQVTHLPLDIQAYVVSPDGHRLVVSMAVFPNADPPDATYARLNAPKAGAQAPKATGMVFDRLFVRHWDQWADGTRNHLFSLTLDPAGNAGRPAIPLMPGFDGDCPSRPFGDDADFSISPDGHTVFFSARQAGRSEPWSTNFDIYSVPADGSHAPVDLTGGNPAWDAEPVPSPDGRTLAWRAQRRPGFEADRFGVMVMDLATHHSREVAGGWDRSASSLAWSSDGRTLGVTAEDVGQLRLFGLDVQSGGVTGLTGDGHVTDVHTASDGGLFYLRDTLDSPAQLWRRRPGGKPEQLTRIGAAQLDGVAMQPFRQFEFTGWNHETVHGYVVRPAGYRPGHRYPVAFLIHGGPQGSFGDGWSYRWNPQFYAGLGYGVVMIDFHGSTGYGQAFTDAISNHWGDRPLTDLRLGWTAALSQFDWLDGSRACALGASYGGFMVNWIAGNWSQPWKCLVTHDGVFDDRMMGFSTEELWFAEWEHGGPGHTPWADPQAYERFDPAGHVADWRVPQLIIHGGRDFRIPLEQGLGAYDALQRRGIESRLLVFPDENHWVLKPDNSLQWHDVVAAWLKAHLGY